VLRTVGIPDRERPEAALTGEAAGFDQRAEERTGKPPTRQRSVSRLQHSLLATPRWRTNCKRLPTPSSASSTPISAASG